MTRANEKIGIDANPLLDAQTGTLAPQVANPALLTDTGVGWVRVKFALGPWSSVDDATHHDGRTWAEAYRAVVDGLRRPGDGEGLRLYGLIDHDIVDSDPGDALRNPPPDEGLAETAGHAWLDRYVAAFVHVVEWFRPDVPIFESFHEPDDWHGSSRNWVHPEWFAILLERIARAVKARPDLQDVRLVSGPLQGWTLNNNAAAVYLQTTYAAGKRRFGWGEPGTPVPFDGVGYHLLVAQEEQPHLSPQAQQEAARAEFTQYIADLRRVIHAAEGRDKPIYLSAFGWQTNHNAEDFQAQRLRQAVELILADPGIALGIWAALQDSGPPDGDRFNGLVRPGALEPAQRKPAYAALRELCARQLPVVQVGSFDNRLLVRAVGEAAREVGQNRYRLIDQGNLWGTFLNRAARYQGPALADLPGLDPDARRAIEANLAALLLDDGQRRGATTAALLNLRAGPGTDHPVLAQLPQQTSILILQEKGEWLRIEAQGKEGFVHREFVTLPDEQLPDGFLRNRDDLAALTLAPPQDKLINAATVQTPAERLLAYIWNRYGRLLAAVADEMHIDPAVAAAVVAVESGGKGFADDGRMIIRFENHRFHHYWGQAHPEVFNQHFRFDADRPWLGHRWRPTPDGEFREQHQWQGSLADNQRGEWESFTFAATLDPRAARLAISMGAPQILGSNHAVIGYESVEQMFDAFAGGDHAQLLGLFDFIKANPQRARSLQRRDYRTFAELYNGNGQADHYAQLITAQVAAFDDILARQDAVSFGAPADFEIDTGGISFLPPLWPAPPTSQVDAGAGGEEGANGTATASAPVVSETLRTAWEEYMAQGLRNNNKMFNRTLRAYLIPYYLTVALYVILFLVGIGLFVVSAWLAARQGSDVTALVFAGLGTLTFVALFIRHPLRALEENLQFITWLGLIYNTYWTRLLYMQNRTTVQADLESATQMAIKELERLIDKNADLASRRPGSDQTDR